MINLFIFVRGFVSWIVLMNVGLFCMIWLVVSINNIGFLLFDVVSSVVKVIVGVVLCLIGFNIMLLCNKFCCLSCLVIINLCFVLYIINGERWGRFFNLSKVFWNIFNFDVRVKNCLG